jgi:hypothetical protein
MVTTGGVLPTAEQELLLRAALWSGERATAAWLEWASRVDVVNDLVDEGSFRLLPLVYRNLDRVGLAGPSMSRLKGVYRHSWAKNIALFRETQRVLHRLGGAGIDTIIMNGIALTHLYYQDFETRPMSDIVDHQSRSRSDRLRGRALHATRRRRGSTISAGIDRGPDTIAGKEA